MTHFTLALLLAVQAADAGTLLGRITDATQAGPVAGALVEVMGAGYRAESDSAGSYRLPPLSGGWHRLRFQRFGYRTVELQAYVQDGGVTRLDVALLVHPLPLSRVEVTGRADALPADPGFSSTAASVHAGARSLIPQNGGQPLYDRPELPQLLSTLPDIAQRPDGGGGLQLRGGSADHNLVLLDGAPILNPVHAMGLAGALNPDAIGAVDVFAGVVPAQFGGRLSGVVSIESRLPDRDRWRAHGGADGFSVGLAVDGPLPLVRGGLLLSARKSSSGVLATLYERDSKLPRFRDTYAALSMDAGPGVLRLGSYRSSDALGFLQEPETVDEAAPPDTGNRFSWDGGTDAASWRSNRVEVIGWRADTDARGSWRDVEGAYELDSRVQNLGARSLVAWPRARGWVRLGASVEHTRVRYGIDRPNALESPVTRTTESAISGEWRESLGSRFALTAAMRASVVTGGDPALEPRVSLSLVPSSNTLLALGYTRSRQILQSLRNQESALDVAVPAEFPGFLGGEESSAISDQVTAALQTRPSPGSVLTLDLYARRMDGLVLVAPMTREPLAVGAFVMGRGRAMGALASAEIVRDSWQASAAYHLGTASRRSFGTEYRPSFQRAQWAMAGTSYQISRHISLRGALRAGSGAPTSPIGEGFVWEANDPLLGEGDLAGTPLRATGALNEATLPAYLRLDLGARAGWDLSVAGRTGRISTFLTVENLLNHRNVLTYQLDPASGVLLPIPLRPMGLNAGLRFEY